MPHESSLTAKQVLTQQVKSVQVGSWKIDLLPRAPYEASYTPEQSIIGYTFDSQAGTHAFASKIGISAGFFCVFLKVLWGEHLISTLSTNV